MKTTMHSAACAYDPPAHGLAADALRVIHIHRAPTFGS